MVEIVGVAGLVRLPGAGGGCSGVRDGSALPASPPPRSVCLVGGMASLTGERIPLCRRMAEALFLRRRLCSCRREAGAGAARSHGKRKLALEARTQAMCVRVRWAEIVPRRGSDVQTAASYAGSPAHDVGYTLPPSNRRAA